MVFGFFCLFVWFGFIFRQQYETVFCFEYLIGDIQILYFALFFMITCFSRYFEVDEWAACRTVKYHLEDIYEY